MDKVLLSKLAKLCCDCELSPEEAAAWQKLQSQSATKTQASQQVEFEQKLRCCVADALKESCHCAPESLSKQIHSQLEEADFPQPTVVGRISDKSEDAKESHRSIFDAFFSGPHRANAFAVAATIALISGAILFGIFGRHIDDVRSVSEIVVAASEFASNEHNRIALDQSNLEKKVFATSFEEAKAKLSKWLDSPVEVFELDEVGYEFCGAGPCAVPGSDRSCHILYRKRSAGDGPKPMVSIFIAPDTGTEIQNMTSDLLPGDWGVSPKSSSCVHSVLRGTDGKLVYLMVCCSDSDLPNVANAVAPQLASRFNR